MKNGLKTTEFWFSLAAAVWGAVHTALPAWAHAVVPAVASVAYALSRGLAKSNPLPPLSGFTSGNP